MLVLSRKEGERLVIGDNITIVVSKVSGNRVSIGIEAPRDVKIVRGELPELEAKMVKEDFLLGSYKAKGKSPVLQLQRQVG
jgi:carbon storage regulator